MVMRLRIAYLAAAAMASFFMGSLSRAQDRYDHRVRQFFFTGFTGNMEELEKGMKITEATLKENPNHAEALVWHGSGMYYQAGQAFQKGDRQKGMELAMKGIAMMDKAVELEPDNVGVRIPRGAMLLTATRFQPPSDFVASLVARAGADYEHVYKLQEKHLNQLGSHPQGELLFGMADVANRKGDKEKARAVYTQAAESLPGTPYEKFAREWLEKGTLSAQKSGCIGCHAGK
jgi:tetratricopeptide (TPR) repeat protein